MTLARLVRRHESAILYVRCTVVCTRRVGRRCADHTSCHQQTSACSPSPPCSPHLHCHSALHQQPTTSQLQTADSAPGAATWDVTLSARKVVPCVRWPTTGILLRTVYSQAQGCMCTAFQLGGDVEQPWLMSKYDVIHKTGIT